jgi:hypothetical protein
MYDALVNTLISGGAKGVVANIPYVNTFLFHVYSYKSSTVECGTGGGIRCLEQ